MLVSNPRKKKNHSPDSIIKKSTEKKIQNLGVTPAPVHAPGIQMRIGMMIYR